jgi:spore maturation protein SpmB
MCLFLAINTSNVSLLPLGVIAVRAAAGATSPGSILIPTIVATSCATLCGITLAKFFARRSPDPAPLPQEEIPPMVTEDNASAEEVRRPGFAGKLVAMLVIVAFIAAIPYHYIAMHRLPAFNYHLLTRATGWLVPALMGSFLLFGYFRGVKVYESLTDGAKEGFHVAIRIIPFLVAIFVAISMFRESGALELLTRILSPVFSRIGFPIEALPVALLRPLSGTGSFAAMTEVINRAPDSFASFLVSVLQGSTETTFYVLAVYFGSVGIRRSRYALTVGLLADAVGITAALCVSHLLFRV